MEANYLHKLRVVPHSRGALRRQLFQVLDSFLLTKA